MEGSECIGFGAFRVYSRNDDLNISRTIRKLKNIKMDDSNDGIIKKLMMNGSRSMVSQIDLIHGFESLLTNRNEAEVKCPKSFEFLSTLNISNCTSVDIIQLMNFDEIHLTLRYAQIMTESNMKALINHGANKLLISHKIDENKTYATIKIDPVELTDFFRHLYIDTLQAIGQYGNKVSNVGMLQDVQVLNLQSLSLMYAYVVYKSKGTISYSHHSLCIQPNSIVSILGMMVLGSEFNVQLKSLMSKFNSEILIVVRDRLFFNGFGPIPLAFRRATFRAFRAGGSSTFLDLNGAHSF